MAFFKYSYIRNEENQVFFECSTFVHRTFLAFIEKNFEQSEI